MRNGRQVGVDALVGLGDELSVEPLLAPSGLVAAAQDDASALRVEGEGESPDTACGIEAQFLHVRVARALERVDAWTPELGSKHLQYSHMRQQLVLNGLGQRVELRDGQRPKPHVTMALKAYGVNSILIDGAEDAASVAAGGEAFLRHDRDPVTSAARRASCLVHEGDRLAKS